MTLSKKSTRDGRTRYYIQEMDGRSQPNTIAWFDTLGEAAVVLRYLKGAWMENGDQRTALRLINEWDTKNINNHT